MSSLRRTISLSEQVAGRWNHRSRTTCKSRWFLEWGVPQRRGRRSPRGMSDAIHETGQSERRKGQYYDRVNRGETGQDLVNAVCAQRPETLFGQRRVDRCKGTGGIFPKRQPFAAWALIIMSCLTNAENTAANRHGASYHSRSTEPPHGTIRDHVCKTRGSAFDLVRTQQSLSGLAIGQGHSRKRLGGTLQCRGTTRGAVAQYDSRTVTRCCSTTSRP